MCFVLSVVVVVDVHCTSEMLNVERFHNECVVCCDAEFIEEARISMLLIYPLDGYPFLRRERKIARWTFFFFSFSLRFCLYFSFNDVAKLKFEYETAQYTTAPNTHNKISSFFYHE